MVNLRPGRPPASLLNLCAALITLGGLLLAACGESPTATPANSPAPTTRSGQAGPTTPPGAVTSSTSASTAPPAAVKLNKNVAGTVEFWHFWASPVRRNAIRRIMAICQAELPNIRVNDTYKPFGEIWTANNKAVAAGSGMPDVIVEDMPRLSAAGLNNIETSLQKLADRDGLSGSGFWPFVWQQTLYNNETYGIPFETDVRVLYWNKSAFREAGLDPEKPPRTWSEVEEYANKLDRKNPDGTYARWGFMPLVNSSWDLWAFNNDAPLLKEGRIQVNDPKVIETFNWIKKWIDRFGGWAAYTKFRSTFQAPPQDAFMSGKVAMLADINGYASSLNFYRPRYTDKDGKQETMEWGISDIPHNDNARQSSFSGGFALSIPRGAKNTEAAWEFIKCATGPDAQLSWARDTYSMPTRPAVASDPLLQVDANWQFMVKAMSYIAAPTFIKEYPTWNEQVEKRTPDIYEGKLDPRTALEQAQQAIDAEVAKNKK